MVRRRLRANDTFHVHDVAETVALNEKIVLRRLVLTFGDDRAVDGMDALDDDVGELALNLMKPEVAVLLVVDVDSQSVVMRDDVDLLGLELELAMADERPLDFIESEFELGGKWT